MEKLRLHPPPPMTRWAVRTVFLYNNTRPLRNLTLPGKILIVFLPSQVDDDVLAAVVVLMSHIAVSPSSSSSVDEIWGLFCCTFVNLQQETLSCIVWCCPWC